VASECSLFNPSTLSFVESIVNYLSVMAVDLSEAKVLEPVEVESSESELSESDPGTGSASSEFSASGEDSDEERSLKCRRKKRMATKTRRDLDQMDETAYYFRPDELPSMENEPGVNILKRFLSQARSFLSVMAHDIQHNDTHHNIKVITTLTIMTMSITTLNALC